MVNKTLKTLDRIRFDQFPANVPPAVVLGLNPNALATIRSLGSKEIPVIGIDSNLKQMSAHSRYCSKVYCEDYTYGGEKLLECLVALGKRLPVKGVVFPSGDLGLLTISENREILSDYYRFMLPDKEVVRLIVNKRDFYRFAVQRGYSIPLTFIPEHPGEVEKIAGEISYPCIIKPYFPDESWRRKFTIKLFEAYTPQSLVETFSDLVKVHNDLIIQEIIPGEEQELVCSMAYLDENSEPLAMFTGRKLRQSPPKWGSSSMMISEWMEEVAELSESIFKELRYKGYCSIEFKRDEGDGKLKIIEVTGRTWYPHGLTTYCGMNIPYLWYRHCLGEKVEKIDGFREGIKWIDEFEDLKSSYRYWRNGEITFSSWIRSYRGVKTFAFYHKDDKGPFLHFLLRVLSSPYRKSRNLLKSFLDSNGASKM